MGISLFAHNENAYRAALAMLKKTGKAAVIHPTGTGKSFIGFKFCEDFPEKKICWLSPSEHIFKAQLDNLAADCGIVPKNITFLTYARRVCQVFCVSKILEGEKGINVQSAESVGE